MKEQNSLWPVDRNFGDKLVWDASVGLAYRYNELVDALKEQENLLAVQFGKPSNEKIDLRKEQIIECIDDMRENERTLAHVIGQCIGRDGLVAQSPYNQYDMLTGDDADKGVIYMIDGVEQHIEST